MRIAKRWLKRLVILGMPFAALGGYWTYYEMYSRELVFDRGIFYENANGIKHAYAAGQMFLVLRTVMGDELAEEAVLAMGNFNERIEQVVRRPRDSAALSLQDLWNNQVGITTAKWYAAQSTKTSLSETIIELAKHPEILCLTGAQAATYGLSETELGQTAVTQAIARFEVMRADIATNARSALK